ncbi:MAG: CinA family nicotinamide mononucleotide deamidase-related protein [Elusimicrobiota bacterium]|nr:CinA family nicotinamide mononucleotide deamidase-related protein [Elusimicrobiota bacterium]
MSRAPAPAPAVELVFVGSELLAGQVNTHQAWMSSRLRAAGLTVTGAASVPDDRAAIAAALRRAAGRAALVVACGGLGPTFDDLTREATAAAFGRTLRFDPRLWRVIERRFRRFHARVPEENKRQAEVLSGAEVLANPNGSAPGQVLTATAGGRRVPVFLLPGPHPEMAPLFLKAVRPRARRLVRGGFASWSARLVGVPESVADELLAPVRAAFPEASYTILASGGEISFHATVRGASAAAARGTRARLRRAALAAVGRWAYGEDDDTLDAAVGARLKARGLTLAVAESCTGGLVGGRLTAVPGASAWFKGGVIAYADAVKRRALKVPAAVLARRGAVSAECAAAMARGARASAGAAVGLAVTGIAGPGGARPGKPVGTVFIAVSGPGRRERARRLALHGSREEVRRRSASAALALAWESLA